MASAEDQVAELTTRWVERRPSRSDAARSLTQNLTLLGQVPYAFAGLPLFGFDLIMADPNYPWRAYSPNGHGKSPEKHYRTMSIDKIAALPVQLLAAPNAVLFLWCTWPLLLDGGSGRRSDLGDPARSPIGEVMGGWGFRYVTGGAWVKTTRHGKLAFGTGYRARSTTEPFLIGVRGNPLNTRASRNLIESGLEEIRGERRQHSRKPDEAFAWCERYLPGARRLELFSRATERKGWTIHGDQLGTFK